MNKIGLAFKKWLSEKGITQQEVADYLGVSPQYVNGLCSDRKTIGKEIAKKLANRYGLSEAFLLTGEGDIVNGKEKTVFQSAVNKANRFAQVLNYLVDEGRIENWMEIARKLNVTDAVIKKATKYDPNGDTDKLLLKISRMYPEIDIVWVLTGERNMLVEKSEVEPIDHSSLVNALLSAKDETIYALRQQIIAKDSLIKKFRQTEQELRAKISELENNKELDEYPFTPGVSDHHDKEQPSV